LLSSYDTRGGFTYCSEARVALDKLTAGPLAWSYSLEIFENGQHFYTRKSPAAWYAAKELRDKFKVPD